MTFVVPYDGSDLAEAALVRASEYAEALDEEIIAITVVPDGKRYAVEKGWIDPGGEYAAREVIGALHERVTELAPEASFQSVRLDPGARAGTIAKHLRQRAVDLDATVVFIGSDNAGRIVVSVSSVGGSVAADSRYDIYIVRQRAAPRVEGLRPKSDFYVRE